MFQLNITYPYIMRLGPQLPYKSLSTTLGIIQCRLRRFFVGLWILLCNSCINPKYLEESVALYRWGYYPQGAYCSLQVKSQNVSVWWMGQGTNVSH